MRLTRIVPVVLLLASVPLLAQDQHATAAPDHQGAPAASVEPPPFNVDMLDRSVDACTDFYRFACGKWLAANPIPPDQPEWGRFNELAERNRAILRQILEKASVPDPKRDAVMQKIGDYYASCMKAEDIDRKGIAPLEPELDRIAAMKDKKALPGELAHLQRIGVNAVFSFSSDQDYKNANEVIAEADQGGLGLPDREYYFRTDKNPSKATPGIRGPRAENVRAPSGENPQQAVADAKTVMDMETAMAKASMGLVQRRTRKTSITR